MATETTSAVQPKQSPKPAKDEPHIEVKEVNPEASADAKSETPLDPGARLVRAEAIIRRNVLWSFGAGILPLPVFDMVAVTGVQIKMLHELSKLYGLTFREDIAKKLLGSLASGVVGISVGTAIGASFMKLIPGIGTALGIVTVPIVAGAFTHATGKIFMMHFEAGGTLLDFDAHSMHAHFKSEFEKGKEVAAKLRVEEASKSS